MPGDHITSQSDGQDFFEMFICGGGLHEGHRFLENWFALVEKMVEDVCNDFQSIREPVKIENMESEDLDYENLGINSKDLDTRRYKKIQEDVHQEGEKFEKVTIEKLDGRNESKHQQEGIIETVNNENLNNDNQLIYQEEKEFEIVMNKNVDNSNQLKCQKEGVIRTVNSEDLDIDIQVMQQEEEKNEILVTEDLDSKYQLKHIEEEIIKTANSEVLNINNQFVHQEEEKFEILMTEDLDSRNQSNNQQEGVIKSGNSEDLDTSNKFMHQEQEKIRIDDLDNIDQLKHQQEGIIKAVYEKDLNISNQVIPQDKEKMKIMTTEKFESRGQLKHEQKKTILTENSQDLDIGNQKEEQTEIATTADLQSTVQLKQQKRIHIKDSYILKYNGRNNRANYSNKIPIYVKSFKIDNKHKNILRKMSKKNGNNQNKHVQLIPNYQRNLDSHAINRSFLHPKCRTCKCYLCACPLVAKKKLKEHLLQEHLSPKVFKCSLCQYETTKKKLVKKHIELFHLNQGQDESHKCPSSQFSIKEAQTLSGNTKTIEQSPIKRFRCNLCNYMACRKASVKVHIREVHLKSIRYLKII